jgi:hypothetical protein
MDPRPLRYLVSREVQENLGPHAGRCLPAGALDSHAGGEGEKDIKDDDCASHGNLFLSHE